MQTSRNLSMQTHRPYDVRTCKRTYTRKQACWHADIQTYGYADMLACRHTDTWICRHTDIWICRHVGMQTYINMDMQACWHADIQTYWYADMLAYRQQIKANGSVLPRSILQYSSGDVGHWKQKKYMYTSEDPCGVTKLYKETGGIP